MKYSILIAIVTGCFASVLSGAELSFDPVLSAVKADAKNVEGRFYVVKAGDTLGSIARHFYGKASMEDMIFRANSKLLKNRNTLRIGMRLAIPDL